MLVVETELRRVEAVAFSPCGRFVAAGGLGVELWSLGLEQVWRWGWEKQGGYRTNYVTRLAFHPSGSPVYALDTIGSLSQFLTADGSDVRFRPRIFPFNSFVVGPHDGRVIAVGRGELTCWTEPPPSTEYGPRGEAWQHLNATVGTEIWNVALPLGGSVLTHETTPDDTRFVLRDPTTGAVMDSFPCHLRHMKRLAASPCGRFLAAARENTLRVWSLANFKWPPRVLTNDTKKEITDFAFHPGGQFLATVSNDRGVKLWNVETWQPVKTFDWHEGRMRSLAFSPDGLVAAAGSDTGQVVLFDVDV